MVLRNDAREKGRSAIAEHSRHIFSRTHRRSLLIARPSDRAAAQGLEPPLLKSTENLLEHANVSAGLDEHHEPNKFGFFSTKLRQPGL